MGVMRHTERAGDNPTPPIRSRSFGQMRSFAPDRRKLLIGGAIRGLIDARIAHFARPGRQDAGNTPPLNLVRQSEASGSP